jgi:hypothetical protein
VTGISESAATQTLPTALSRRPIGPRDTGSHVGCRAWECRLDRHRHPGCCDPRPGGAQSELSLALKSALAGIDDKTALVAALAVRLARPVVRVFGGASRSEGRRPEPRMTATAHKKLERPEAAFSS